MEPCHLHSSQVTAALNLSKHLTCGGPTCGLYTSNNNSMDVKERSTSLRKLLIASVLCLIFMCVEVVGGIKANSLAILTDAARLLSDVAAFAISLFSIWASNWEATPHRTYGDYRMEILGALLSIQLIWLLTSIIIYEAVTRVIHGSSEVHGVLIFAIAGFGWLVNMIIVILLGHDHSHAVHVHGHGHNHDHDHKKIGHQQDHGHDEEHNQNFNINISNQDGNQSPRQTKKQNINIRSAYLHALGDSIQSFGVMVGGGIIWLKPEWKAVDLVCTLLFSLIVLITIITILRNILSVLMENTPREIDATKLGRGLCEVEGVVAIHELHIWTITIGKVLLSCHVTITQEADVNSILEQLINYIKKEYNICHVTIQVEKKTKAMLDANSNECQPSLDIMVM
ncbi:hypothetical protein HPP92_023454 [Vanilla planifolia]|uniref:Uncharacterized protein n=1 Tax=Vanilla planifolia TaxID=51239 RepID=A0A835PTZ1_VANPL|nr:hypothetical protein HPP92_023454 [Vanilla planifolia]